jgi:hypothetical protein
VSTNTEQVTCRRMLKDNTRTVGINYKTHVHEELYYSVISLSYDGAGILALYVCSIKCGPGVKGKLGQQCILSVSLVGHLSPTSNL